MRPKQGGKVVGQLREVAIQLLPNAAGDEGKPFQKPFHVRCGAAVRQHRRELGIGPGKLLAQLPQVRKLVLIVFVEHYSITCMPPAEPSLMVKAKVTSSSSISSRAWISKRISKGLSGSSTN